MHFVVTGESMTRQARDFMLDGDWRRAFKWIQDGLPGISYDQIVDILKGEKKLIGENNLELVDDDVSDPDVVKYLNTLDYMYYGIYRQGQKFYRPYAILEGFGPDDVKYAREKTGYKFSFFIPGREVLNQNLINARCMYYADDPDHDIVQNVKRHLLDDSVVTSSVTILCKEIVDIPIWMLFEKNVQKAYDVIVEKYNGLPLRGYKGGSMNPKWIPTGEQHLSETLKYPKTPDVSKEIVREEEKEREKSVAFYMSKVLDQTKDWYTFSYDGNQYRMPLAPWENYCLWRTCGAHLAMPWTMCAPEGFKIYALDDRYHTDWLLGLQINRNNTWENVYEDPANYEDEKNLKNYLDNLMGSYQEEKLGFDVQVLAGNGSVYGEVIHPMSDTKISEKCIAVIPSARPEWSIVANQIAKYGGAIITEQGGVLCHLAIVGRETNLRLVRIEKATQKYPVGTRLILDCDKGKLNISTAMIRGLL